jgi:hypothetical protein
MPAARPIAISTIMGLTAPSRGHSSGTRLRFTITVVCALALGVAAPAHAEVTATFRAKSYAPGTVARLELTGATGPVRVTIEQAGPEPQRTLSAVSMDGVAVEPARTMPAAGGYVPIHRWPSGLYFARVATREGIAFAPFVVRADARDHVRVAVVEPTNTWEAYNFRDLDTWYAGCACAVDLDRPFLDRGVPPHYHQYDEGFIRWLAHTGNAADFLTDDDLERARSGDQLARLYDLIVFPGHEEYVTTHEYDVIQRYRDLGGNLMFLSADNFFYRVTRSGHFISRTGKWRDLGRPEAALVGVEYAGWNERTFGNAPFVVDGVGAAPWLFRGTGLHDGSRFGKFGIEIDQLAPQSPPGTRILCSIPDAFGPGMTAEMTYYTTPRGAKVFAAGVMNFGGWSEWPPVRQMLENLWARLSEP